MVTLATAEEPAAAWQHEVVIEVGASHIRPPLGVTGDAASYLSAGLRGAWTSRNGSGFLGSVQGGLAADGSSGGDFVSAEIIGSAWLDMGSGWSVGLRGRGLGFWVGPPFPYRVGAAEGGPSVLLTHPRFSLRLDGVGGVGRSRMDFRSTLPDEGWTDPWTDHGPMHPPNQPPDSPEVNVLDADLWRYGGKAEFLARLGPVSAGVAGGIHETAGGSFQSAGLRIMGGKRRLAVSGRLDSWWTPNGQDVTGGVWLSLTLGDSWSLRSFLGRAEPDPLTLAASSSGGGGIFVGRRLERFSGGGAPLPVHQTLTRTSKGAAIRFNVRPGSAAESVQLVGDFTLWAPRTMKRSGGVWTLEMEISEGLYHFGFLVDGEWFVPDEARDTVPDEWGRSSATLLVEPAGAR